MTEHVQVPVSLDTNALRQVARNEAVWETEAALVEAAADEIDRLRALLSQSTPTADTIVIDDPVAGRIEQHVRCRTRPPQPAMLLGHDFLPVAGHPDDDECTYRTDGTDATYCGATLAEHVGATQAQVDYWRTLAKRYPPSKPAEPPRIEDMAPGTTEIYQPDTHAIADSDLKDDLG